MNHDRIMKEASDYAHEADEANARADALESEAASLRVQADQKSAEAQSERDLANRKIAAAQAAVRTAMSGQDHNIIDAAVRRERTTGMASAAGGGGTAVVRPWYYFGREEPWLGAVSLVIAIIALLLLLWAWSNRNDGTVTRNSQLSSKIDQVQTGIDKANGKLDTIGGQTGLLPQINDNSAKAAVSAASAASAAAACKQACEQKPAAVIRQRRSTKPAQLAVTTPAGRTTTAGLDIHKPSAVECRWSSNGSLRLKEATSLLPADPLKEIPYGVTVETIPKAKLGAGETCASWQEKLESRKADLTPRDRATFHK